MTDEIVNDTKSTEYDPDPIPTAEDRLRKLMLDNEDLRFESVRLKAALERAQDDILALTARVTVLQHRLDRLRRWAPRGSRRLFDMARRWLDRP